MTVTATVLGITSLSCTTSWPDASANSLEWQESHLCASPEPQLETKQFVLPAEAQVLRDDIPGRVQGQ